MSKKSVVSDSAVEEIEHKLLNVGKVEPFGGTAAEDVALWMNRFELLAKVNNWTAQRRLAHLCVSLTGTAELWLYSQPETTRSDFDKLREALLHSFAPVVGNSMFLRRKLMNVSQAPGQTVDAYAFEVRNICSRINAVMADEEVITYFVNGLHPVIQEYVLLQGPSSFEACLEAARRKEYLLLTSGVGPGRAAAIGAIGTQSEVEKRLELLEKKLDMLVTRRQESSGGAQYRRPMGRSTRTTDGRPICFNCSKVGHVAARCPEPKKERVEPKNASRFGGQSVNAVEEGTNSN